MTSNALAFAAGAMIDGFIMELFFIINNNFSYEKLFDIFIEELSYKLMYGLISAIIIDFTLNRLKNNKSLNINSLL